MRRLPFSSLTLALLSTPWTSTALIHAAETVTPPVVHADDNKDSDKSDKLVITANRRDTKLSRTVASTDVISADDVRERGYQPFVHDWLRGLPGVDVNGSGGGVADNMQIRLRGAKTGETRMMRDGIPITNATSISNELPLEFLDHGGVNQVEIVRGAQSGLYGSGAIGGVVNIIGARPTAEHHAQGNIDYGSYNTLAGSAQATGPINNNFGYAVSISGIDSDGFSTATNAGDNGDPKNYEEDGFYRYGTTARLEAKNDVGLLYISGYFNKGRSEFDNDYPPPSFNLDPNDPHAYQTYNSWRLAGGGSARLSEHFSLSSDVAHTVTDRQFPNESFFTKSFVANDTYATVQANGYVAGMFRAQIGVDGLWQHAEIVNAANTTTIDRGARIVGSWLSISYDLPWLSLEALGRHDDHSKEGNADTYRLSGATFWFQECYKVFASVGSGFRAPTLYELYNPGSGNDQLKPQTSLSADAGHTIRFTDSGLSLTNTVFITQYKDAITFESVFPYRSINVPTDSRIYGIENALRYDQQIFSTGITYTYQDSDDGTGKRLSQLPDNKMMVDGTVRQFNAWLRIAVERVWSRSSGGQELPPYTLVSASLGYSLTKNWGVYARFDNITDEGYEIYPAYSTPRQAAYGGVRAHF